MDSLFQVNFADLMCSLLSKVGIFGVSVFGDGATIKSIPLINILAASPNNPFALLDIVDCTAHLREGGKKDAPYLANMILPHILTIKSLRDENNNHRKGVVDLVLFDGASNVKIAGRILAINHLQITVVRGAEHVMSLFFKDVYTHVSSSSLCLHLIISSCLHLIVSSSAPCSNCYLNLEKG
jgi:hypothetical protein